MRAKKKLSRPMRLLRKYLLILMSLILAVVIFFEVTVRDRLELVIISEIKMRTNHAINTAASEYIKNNEQLCNNLINITADSSSQIKSITESAYYINVFKTDISKVIQEYVDSMLDDESIDVKLGNFVGLTILCESGPFVKVNIESTPNITCELQSSFESAGVNQTIHHIVLFVNADIYVGNPFRIESIKFTNDIEVAQTVIVGAIPSTYGQISRY